MFEYMILITCEDEASTIKLFETYDEAARYGNIAVANGCEATLFRQSENNNYVEVFTF